VDLGLPGVLPVLNAEVVRLAAKFGLATHSTVARRSVFDRKNYFYPDLPKGYQISQLALPIVHGGYLDIDLDDGVTKRIGLTRAHLEGMTGIDLNRAGTPLLEIVSEPELRSATEAVAYMRKIHSLVRYLGISDGNMQEGSFRCDANVSVRPRGQEEFGTRAEIKNINSFRFVEQAINLEVERQIMLLESGGTVVQETRLFDPDKHETRPMRSKEEANDYRYFPDPDLLPVELDDDFIEAVRKTLPELPDARKARFVSEHGLSEYDAGVLTASRELADYFEAVVTASGGQGKLSANWVMGELSGALNRNDCDIAASPVSAEALAAMLKRIEDGTISGKIAKQVFEAMWNGAGSADEIIEQQGLQQISDSSAIEAIIREVLDNNPKQIEQYRGGQQKLFGFFVGQVMKATQGKANPKQVNELLRKLLDS
jgi:aspartyl-tRNA(Asn)/glutamyl-tRNA(Gln) amidotransferase subunit B